MRFMKEFAIAAMLVVCALLLTGCFAVDVIGAMMLAGGDDEVSKEEVFASVSDNAEALSSFPYDEMPRGDDSEKKQFIRNHLGEDTIVKSVHRYDSNTLDFYCGGKGNVTSSVYSGFYHSEDNEPSALEFEGEAVFTETEDGKFEWSNEDGQRQFLAERIQPNWFYYRMIWG